MDLDILNGPRPVAKHEVWLVHLKTLRNNANWDVLEQ